MTARKSNPQKTGRKSKYKPEYDILAHKYALLGLTDAKMSDLFDVDESTFNRWKKAYPSFRASIKEAKEIADAEVVHSLRQRALGATTKEVRTTTNPDGEITTQVTTKQNPPDATSAIFWLKNRQPQHWRDKQVQEHALNLDLAAFFANIKSTLGPPSERKRSD